MFDFKISIKLNKLYRIESSFVPEEICDFVVLFEVSAVMSHTNWQALTAFIVIDQEKKEKKLANGRAVRQSNRHITK